MNIYFISLAIAAATALLFVTTRSLIARHMRLHDRDGYEPLRLLPYLLLGGGLLVLALHNGLDWSAALSLVGLGGLSAAFIVLPLARELIGRATIVLDDLFQPGHVVEIGDHIGVVGRMGARTFDLEGPDGTRVTLPNTAAVTLPLRNYTERPGYRVRVELPIDDPNFDAERTTHLLDLTAAQWSYRGRSGFAQIERIGSSAVHYGVYGWIASRIDAPIEKARLLSACMRTLDDAAIRYGETGNISFRGESLRLSGDR